LLISQRISYRQNEALHNKQRYKFTFIDYNENGCRIKIHKNLLPDINLKNHLDYSLSFKNHTREYLCDLITITDKDNYFYIGIQFLESVYERINLLPAHLEFN